MAIVGLLFLGVLIKKSTVGFHFLIFKLFNLSYNVPSLNFVTSSMHLVSTPKALIVGWVFVLSATGIRPCIVGRATVSGYDPRKCRYTITLAHAYNCSGHDHEA